MRTLRNAVEHGKVHHAYLFVGSRGTGKTSMAKILAIRSVLCDPLVQLVAQSKWTQWANTNKISFYLTLANTNKIKSTFFIDY